MLRHVAMPNAHFPCNLKSMALSTLPEISYIIGHPARRDHDPNNLQADVTRRR